MKITSSIPQKEKFFERFEPNARRHLPSTLRRSVDGRNAKKIRHGFCGRQKLCLCHFFCIATAENFSAVAAAARGACDVSIAASESYLMVTSFPAIAER